MIGRRSELYDESRLTETAICRQGEFPGKVKLVDVGVMREGKLAHNMIILTASWILEFIPYTRSLVWMSFRSCLAHGAALPERPWDCGRGQHLISNK